MNFDNNEFDYPIQRFEQMISSNEIVFFDSVEFENIINYYLDSGRIGLAKRALKYALDQHPDTTNLKILQADVFIFEEKYKEAEKLLIEILETDPRNEEIFILMANVLSKKNKNHEAVDCLLKALDLTNEKEDIHHLIGMEYMNLELYDLAIFHFVRSISDDFPEDATAIVNIVFCFEESNKIEEAINFLNDYLDKKPYCEIAWHQLGILYSNQGELSKALDAFEYAIISDESFVGAIIEKAKIHEQMHQYDEAIKLYVQTLKLEDPTAFAYFKLGTCYAAKGDILSAVKHLHKCVLEDPQMSQAWTLLMDISVAENELEKAFRYANKALNIDPYNQLKWNSLFVIIQLIDCEKERYFLDDMLKYSNPFLNYHNKYLNALSTFIDEFGSEFLNPILKAVQLSVVSNPTYLVPIELLNNLLENYEKYSELKFKKALENLKELNFNYFMIFDSVLWDVYLDPVTIDLNQNEKFNLFLDNYVSIAANQNINTSVLDKLFGNDFGIQ